jgi:hypothetical protein
MEATTQNPGQDLLTEIKGWFKNAEQTALTDIEKVGVAVWHVLTTAIAQELPQLPGIVVKAVMGAASAPAGSNKKQVALDSILADLKTTGVQSLASATTANVSDIGAALGLDGNAVDNYITATVAALQAKGLIG